MFMLEIYVDYFLGGSTSLMMCLSESMLCCYSNEGGSSNLHTSKSCIRSSHYKMGPYKLLIKKNHKKENKF